MHNKLSGLAITPEIQKPEHDVHTAQELESVPGAIAILSFSLKSAHFASYALIDNKDKNMV